MGGLDQRCQVCCKCSNDGLKKLCMVVVVVWLLWGETVKTNLKEALLEIVDISAAQSSALTFTLLFCSLTPPTMLDTIKLIGWLEHHIYRQFLVMNNFLNWLISITNWSKITPGYSAALLTLFVRSDILGGSTQKICRTRKFKRRFHGKFML